MTRRLLDNSSSPCDTNVARRDEGAHRFTRSQRLNEAVVALPGAHIAAVPTSIIVKHRHEVTEPDRTTRKSETKYADMHAIATNPDILLLHGDGERKRDKIKKFVADKGPRMAGAAAAIGMFIFNVVSSCT